MIDIHTNIAPVINLSDVPTDIAIAQARTYEKVNITIDHIPDIGKMVIPVRIIEWMEKIVERKIVNQKQAFLISELFELLSSSPKLQSLRM